MTPVNSFRLLFNAYFGGRLAKLDDLSYYSTEDDEYNFLPVENTWTGE